MYIATRRACLEAREAGFLVTLIIIQRYSENENRLYVDINSTSGTSILMASSEDLLMCQSFVIQILSNIQHSNCRIVSNR